MQATKPKAKKQPGVSVLHSRWASASPATTPQEATSVDGDDDGVGMAEAGGAEAGGGD